MAPAASASLWAAPPDGTQLGGTSPLGAGAAGLGEKGYLLGSQLLATCARRDLVLYGPYSRSDQHLSCSGRVQLPQSNIGEVPANSRGAVHRLRRHASNSESQCQESRQMDMMMAAERRRAEEELLQPVHAACLALPVVQASPRPGERAAARRDRFRRRHCERWGCRSRMDRQRASARSQRRLRLICGASSSRT